MLAKNIVATELQIGEIPATLLSYESPDKKLPGVIWYHGWSSSRESQIFRANMIASFGFHVLVADGALHGDRGSTDYEDEEVAYRELPRVILKNLEEFPMLEAAFRENANIEGPIFVTGHSMGAMTAGGILANYPNVGGAICFNGVNDWSLDKFLDERRMDREVARGAERFNPLNHLDKFKERPLLMINGDEDHEVDGKLQEAFYRELRNYYNTDALKFEWAIATPHVVTTNMMEEGIKFLLEHTK